jgi:hypothetical protein
MIFHRISMKGIVGLLRMSRWWWREGHAVARPGSLVSGDVVPLELRELRHRSARRRLVGCCTGEALAERSDRKPDGRLSCGDPHTSSY